MEAKDCNFFLKKLVDTAHKYFEVRIWIGKMAYFYSTVVLKIVY